MKVRVYRNLHRNCFSIQSYVPKRGWRVARHAEIIYLSNVEFRVSKTGRERVLKEKKKNVHAWVTGDECSVFKIPKKRIVRYNPYKNETFINDCGEIICHAPFAKLELVNGRAVMVYSEAVR